MKRVLPFTSGVQLSYHKKLINYIVKNKNVTVNKCMCELCYSYKYTSTCVPNTIIMQVQCKICCCIVG